MGEGAAEPGDAAPRGVGGPRAGGRVRGAIGPVPGDLEIRAMGVQLPPAQLGLDLVDSEREDAGGALLLGEGVPAHRGLVVRGGGGVPGARAAVPRIPAVLWPEPCAFAKLDFFSPWPCGWEINVVFTDIRGGVPLAPLCAVACAHVSAARSVPPFFPAPPPSRSPSVSVPGPRRCV